MVSTYLDKYGDIVILVIVVICIDFEHFIHMVMYVYNCDDYIMSNLIAS